MTTLFVNACVRGEASNTLKLCKEYLKKKQDLVELNLSELNIKPLNAADVAHRDELLAQGAFSDSFFDLARQFAEADEIVVGAPYWDLSFPSLLKVYIEHVSVVGLLFGYTSEGEGVGLSKAKRLTYISTSGGQLDGTHHGYEYFCRLAKMYGIPETQLLVVEGTNLQDADLDTLMADGLKRAREMD